MGVYSVRGFTASTSTGASDLTIAQLWNPHGSIRIKILEAGVHSAGSTGSHCVLCRTTTQGTAGSTVTPDADNGWADDDVVPSGATLGLAAFSAQPTKSSSKLLGMGIRDIGETRAGSAGTGFTWTFPYADLWLPPGQGIAICGIDCDFIAWVASEVYFVWEEK